MKLGFLSSRWARCFVITLFTSCLGCCQPLHFYLKKYLLLNDHQNQTILAETFLTWSSTKLVQRILFHGEIYWNKIFLVWDDQAQSSEICCVPLFNVPYWFCSNHVLMVSVTRWDFWNRWELLSCGTLPILFKLRPLQQVWKKCTLLLL